MPSYKPHEEQPSPPPYNESDLRPDQKRCRRCKASLILEQRRCPFCGNAPWYWNPNARFLVAAIVANLLLIQQPLYQVIFCLQLAFYSSAIVGMFLPGNSLAARAVRLTTMFTSMNLALIVGFWRWLSGKQRGTWQRTAR